MSKKSVKVSIVVPIYKVPEKYLRKCIESLQSQTLKEIEIILVDDGSPDDCGKICDEYAYQDKRIKVIHQENKGLCGARNAGINVCSGEWVTYVDGDDWVETNTYENLIANVNDDIDLICFGYCKDYGIKIVKNDYSKYFENKKIYKTLEEKKYMIKMLLDFNASCATVNTKLIRKSFLVDNSLYHDESLRQGAEGIEFNIRMFNKVKSFKFLTANYYHYTYNDESISTTHNEKNHKMVLNCFDKIKLEIDNNDEELMNCFYNRLKYVIITTAVSGYFSPTNPEKYTIQKKKYNEYLKNKLVKETLAHKNNKNLDFIRRITLFLIKNRIYFFIKIIANIRNKQKKA